MQAQALQNSEAASGRELLLWTIYERPRDFPRHYVARPHRTMRDPGPLDVYLLADSLEGIRAQLPNGLHCLTRADGDEPQILETWL